MNINLKHIDDAIDKGIDFLAEHQFHHGEFCVYMGGGEDLKAWCVPDSTTFITAMIGTLLLPLRHDSRVQVMMQKGADFLKYQMMRGGAWHFLSKWHKIFPVCPADTDSTACISYFLKEVNYSFPDNVPLLLANRNKKGLFYTWFTFRFGLRGSLTYRMLTLRELKYPLRALLFWTRAECSKGDVDAVVNANVLYYLGQHDHTAPVIPFLLDVIEHRREAACDKWYRNTFQVYYAIARNYQKGIRDLEPAKDPITERILAAVKPDGRIGCSAADTAMAVTSLLHFHGRAGVPEKAVEYLLKQASANGSWPRQALCYGGPKQVVAWGSEELTTALCLEALALYRQALIEKNMKRESLYEVS